MVIGRRKTFCDITFYMVFGLVVYNPVANEFNAHILPAFFDWAYLLQHDKAHQDIHGRFNNNVIKDLLHRALDSDITQFSAWRVYSECYFYGLKNKAPLRNLFSCFFGNLFDVGRKSLSIIIDYLASLVSDLSSLELRCAHTMLSQHFSKIVPFDVPKNALCHPWQYGFWVFDIYILGSTFHGSYKPFCKLWTFVLLPAQWCCWIFAAARNVLR